MRLARGVVSGLVAGLLGACGPAPGADDAAGRALAAARRGALSPLDAQMRALPTCDHVRALRADPLAPLLEFHTVLPDGLPNAEVLRRETVSTAAVERATAYLACVWASTPEGEPIVAIKAMSLFEGRYGGEMRATLARMAASRSPDAEGAGRFLRTLIVYTDPRNRGILGP